MYYKKTKSGRKSSDSFVYVYYRESDTSFKCISVCPFLYAAVHCALTLIKTYAYSESYIYVVRFTKRYADCSPIVFGHLASYSYRYTNFDYFEKPPFV